MPTTILPDDQLPIEADKPVDASSPVESVSAGEIRKATELTYVEDDQGRTLGFRKLRPLEAMDLTEIAGANNATNQAWMLYAMSAFSVFEIDGKRLPRPKNRNELRARVQLLDDAGLSAIIGVLAPSEETEDAENDRAKN